MSRRRAGTTALACERVLTTLDELAAETTERIRAAVPTYRVVPAEQHLRGVRGQHANLLSMLAQARPATAEELSSARRLGRERARQGIPVEDVIEAFHIGCEQAWEAVRAAAAADAPQLLQSVSELWRWVHDAANAVVEGHAQMTQHGHAVAAELRKRLFDLLHQGRLAATAPAAELALSLRYDPAGPFTAVCVDAPGADERIDGLQLSLDRLRGTAHSELRARSALVLFQRMAEDDVFDVLRRHDLAARVGVGLSREGVGGAAASIADATRALRLADATTPVVRFEDAWLLASALEAEERLGALLADEVRAARENPHLTEAVLAYGATGFSITRAASMLQVHPNTVTYRLDRWQELTGRDPRRLDGLMRVHVAALLDRDRDGVVPDPASARRVR